jgi:DNA-binding winged helix-turn-helix (wHTH) protein/tetratricopeptide (TPR) repeat protein
MSEDRPHCYEFGPFRVDPAQRVLLRDGHIVALQPKALEILLLLVRNPGRLIGKEELLTTIWPGLVVEESNLSQNVFLLRRALGDAEGPQRYIVTVPRRGYQFAQAVQIRTAAAPLTTDLAPTPSAHAHKAPPPTPSRKPRIPFLVLGIIASVAVAAMLWAVWGRKSRAALAASDTVVLADFVNSTGDPVFDGALRQGLAAQLEQSPFLNLLSDQRISRTLSLMGKPKGTPISSELAPEICQRTGSAAVIDGSIAKLGTQYLLTLKASACSGGETLAHTQAQANDKNHVLDALGNAASDLRSKLGESLNTVQKYDAPPEAVTTPSLEALQAYGAGYRTMINRNDYSAAIPLFERAISLDPTFAMAHARLGINFFNIGEPGRAEESLRSAYNLREHLSEREKLYITASYNAMATRDFEAARQSYELWAQIYPRDPFAVGNLGVVYGYLGDYEQALTAVRAAAKLDPQNALVFSNVVQVLLQLNRLDEGKAMASKAAALNLDSPSLQSNLYMLSFLQKNQTGMAQATLALADKPDWGDVILYAESDTAAYQGKFVQARNLSQRAVDTAERDHKTEAAAAYEAEGAVREALAGNEALAIRHANAALARSGGKVVQTLAATALGLAGDGAQAGRLADALARDHPQDTVVQFNVVPTIHAATALRAGNSAQAIATLEGIRRYELGQTDQTVAFVMYPVFVRAQAYLAARQGDAIAEFRRIIERPGLVQNEPIAALAHLGLARAYAQANDKTRAKVKYQDFLRLWQNADQDLPLLRTAQQEYAELFKGSP